MLGGFPLVEVILVVMVLLILLLVVLPLMKDEEKIENLEDTNGDDEEDLALQASLHTPFGNYRFYETDISNTYSRLNPSWFTFGSIFNKEVGLILGKKRFLQIHRKKHF